VGVFCAALLIRLLHLQQIHLNDPFFHIPAVDGRLYHEWAIALAGGDFAADDVLILGPLYPYFMAAVYFVYGPNMLALKLLQAVIGALDCLLVAHLARQYFEPRVALFAAATAAFYGMLIFYGGTVMVVNLQVMLILLALIAVTRALREPTARRWGLAGAVIGASVVARQTALLFVPIIVAWLFVDLRERLAVGRRVQLAAAFALGLALLILPFTVRNYVAAGDLVLINSTGGANLYMGNNARSDGSWIPPHFPGQRVDNPLAMRSAFTRAAEAEAGRPLRPSEVSSFWMGRAIAYCLSAPGDWLMLEGRKLLLFFNAREIWNNRSHDISRDFSWVLRLPLLGYGVIAPLGLLGVALSVKRWRELFPLYAMGVTYLMAGLMFFVLSRYRIPIVPILMIFASYAAWRIVDAFRARDTRALTLAISGLLVLAALVNRDMGSENLYKAHFNVGNKYRALERWDEAIDSYGRSLAISPGFISAHNNLALAYEGAERVQEATETWRAVLAWSRKHGDTRRAERAVRHLQALGFDVTVMAGDGPADDGEAGE
jgi:tetratricopeptide (TPR) repeat protein